MPRQKRLGIADCMQRRSSLDMDTFCAEVTGDGWPLLASTTVLSVEKDCSSRLFVVDVRWTMEGEYEERPLASDVDAMSRDVFLERMGLRKLAKKDVWAWVRDGRDGEDVAEGGWRVELTIVV